MNWCGISSCTSVAFSRRGWCRDLSGFGIEGSGHDALAREQLQNARGDALQYNLRERRTRVIFFIMAQIIVKHVTGAVSINYFQLVSIFFLLCLLFFSGQIAFVQCKRILFFSGH